MIEKHLQNRSPSSSEDVNKSVTQRHPQSCLHVQVNEKIKVLVSKGGFLGDILDALKQQTKKGIRAFSETSALEIEGLLVFALNSENKSDYRKLLRRTLPRIAGDLIPESSMQPTLLKRARTALVNQGRGLSRFGLYLFYLNSSCKCHFYGFIHDIHKIEWPNLCI